MNIDSPLFVAFVCCLFAVYWCCRSARAQNMILALSSFAYYAIWNWRMSALLLGTAIWTYLCGMALERRPSRPLQFLSIFPPLLSLGVFKYYDFFIDSINRAFGCDFGLLHLILPLGISFYTFIAIGYLCDVHSRKVEAEKDISRFACFLFFFPQIASGPIGRASEMLPQYAAPRRFDCALAVEGCRQLLWGAFKTAQ